MGDEMDAARWRAEETAKMEMIEKRVAQGERWESEHDGWVKNEWTHQHIANARFEAGMQGLLLRVAALELRIVWVAGLAAGIGASAPGLFSLVFGRG